MAYAVTDPHAPVGVFDSGAGGISVLRELRKLLPGEDFIYYGDSANAPYGDKTESQVCELAWRVTQNLLGRGIKALVIACNTASSAAGAFIRARVNIPVVAMEPALKPASMLTRGGKALVLATQVTLRLEKFRRLMELYGRDALPLPCPGLMEIVERGVTSGPEVDAYFADVARRVAGERIDAVVLGCTHYVFLRAAAQRAFPDSAVLDGNLGTARQLQRLLEAANLLSDKPFGETELITSGGAGDMAVMQRLLCMEPENG